MKGKMKKAEKKRRKIEKFRMIMILGTFVYGIAAAVFFALGNNEIGLILGIGFLILGIVLENHLRKAN